MSHAPASQTTVGTPPTELLAPAGDWDALRAAVACGADAVYFGVGPFNARRRATNFSPDELPRVLDHLHDHNVRGYLTLNTLIFPDEMPAALELAGRAARAGADALIVQDLGLLRAVRALWPTLPLHASTQMTQTCAEGLAVLGRLGVSRVIVARELTLAELGRLRRETTLELEVFVHGALCISYSGQCLASEALWSRSANRGLCGQVCRLPFQLLVDGQPQEHPDRRYVLSAQDLGAWGQVANLVGLGVAGLKIEGRLKGATYVAAATRAYRAALDAALAGERFELSFDAAAELIQGFTRGWTTGFLGGVDHQRLVHARFPKSRGRLIGTVVARTPRGVAVKLASVPAPADEAAYVKPGDGIAFDAGRPDEPEQGGRVYAVRSWRPRPPLPPEPTIELEFGREDVDLAAVAPGCLVWKTDDPVVRRRLEQAARQTDVVHRAPVHAEVELAAGVVPVLHLRDGAGHVATARGTTPVEPARTQPATAAMLRTQLERLGDTPFELASVALRGPDGPAETLPLLLPKSVLNELRRQAAATLQELRRAAQVHAPAAADEAAAARVLETMRPPGAPVPSADGRSVAAAVSALTALPPRLHVLARTSEQCEQVLRWAPPASLGPDGLLYVALAERGDFARVATQARAAGRRVALATPRVLMPGEADEWARELAGGPDAVLVRNLGGLEMVRRAGTDVDVVADATLNAANELTVAGLLGLGAARVTPAHDLSWRQYADLLTRVPPTALEPIVHAHLPLMHLRHCLHAAWLSDGSACGACGWRCRSHVLRLRDRNGAEHLVLPEGTGRSDVFHAACQTAAVHVAALRAAGVRDFRIELLDETAATTARLLELYAELLTGGLAAGAVEAELNRLKPAGVTRGTLSREERD